MEPPFGKCNKKAEHLTTCRVRCFAKFVDEKCGCVMPYMVYVNDSKYITLRSSFSSCLFYRLCAMQTVNRLR